LTSWYISYNEPLAVIPANRPSAMPMPISAELKARCCGFTFCIIIPKDEG
jgi:hypothetical protein